MKGETSVHSPAKGLTDGFGVGGGGGAGQATWHPEIHMTSRDGGGTSQPSGTEDGPTIAGVGATSGAVPFAQIVTSAPSDYDTNGDPMVGGLGTPPRP